MHHTPLVRVRQRPCHLAQQARALLRRQRPVLPDALAQRLTFHIRHREKHQIGELVDGEDGDDVGVREPRRRPRFPEEALARDRVDRLGRG